MGTDTTAESFVNVFDDYHQMIYRYIYFRVRQNKEITEDLSQDTFYKALKKFNDFNRKHASVKTWLFIIARNTVIDFYRSKHRNDVSIENDEELTEEPGQDELKDFVLRKLKLLKAVEKDLIIYKYIYDLPEKEIAEIIGKPYNSTRVLIHRALDKLKQLINEKH